MRLTLPPEDIVRSVMYCQKEAVRSVHVICESPGVMLASNSCR